MSTDITLLGTGTPTPSLKRMCSGYVVETGDDVIVFALPEAVSEIERLF